MQSQDAQSLTDVLDQKIEEVRAALQGDAAEAHATQYVTLETLLRTVMFQQDRVLELLATVRDEVRALRGESAPAIEGGEQTAGGSREA